MAIKTREPFAYLRRSSATTVGNAGQVSYATQEKAVLELARQHGDTKPRVVVEWGKSGADKTGGLGGTGRGGRRKLYAELLKRVEADQVSAIYSYSLSRLARSTQALLELAELCQHHGTSLRLAKEGTMDFSSPSGRFQLTILSAVAQMEAELARDRAQDRVAYARETGRYLGEPPLGWQVGPDGRLIKAETHEIAETVLKIFDSTKNYRETAARLNEMGVPTHRTVTATKRQSAERFMWNASVIRNLVRRERGGPAIKTMRGSRTHQREPLARLLYCSECGSLLTPVRRDYVTPKGTKGQYRAWRCTGKAKGKVTAHGTSNLTERALMPALQAEARRLSVPGDTVALDRASDTQEQTLNERRARIVDALETGTITKAEAEPRLAAMEREREALQQRRVAVNVPPAVDWRWPTEQLAAVLAALWERVEVDMNTGQINALWRVPEWRAKEAA